MLTKRLLRGCVNFNISWKDCHYVGLIQEIGINSLSPALDSKNPQTLMAGIEAAAESEELKKCFVTDKCEDSQVCFS